MNEAMPADFIWKILREHFTEEEIKQVETTMAEDPLLLRWSQISLQAAAKSAIAEVMYGMQQTIAGMQAAIDMPIVTKAAEEEEAQR